MTGQFFLEELLPVLDRIEPNLKIYELFNEIKSSLNEFIIEGSFYQIKKNEKGQGLALEIMFFDEHLIYDLVVAQTTLDYMTIVIKNLTNTYIESSYDQNINAEKQNSVIDTLKLTMTYGYSEILTYSTEIKRFAELNIIKNKLFKLSTK